MDSLADEAVSGLKGFFSQRVDAGEDPTACMQMFSAFFQTNKDKNPQLFRRIASKIDSTFFAPVKALDQIESPGDFVAAFHGLVNTLLDIDSEMPYKVDYGKKTALIDDAKGQVRDSILVEKEEKKKLVDDAYEQVISERKEEYRKSGSGKSLRIGLMICFILFVVLLLVDILVHPQGSEEGMIVFKTVSGLVIGGAVMGLFGEKLGEIGGCVGYPVGVGVGVAAYHGVGWVFIEATALSIFLWLVIGVILAVVHGSKVAAIQLSSEEMSAYNASLASIEDHFSDKEKDEITQSTFRILTADDE